MRDIDRLMQIAVDAGWTVKRTRRSNHLKWKPPTGPGVTTGSTPSAGKHALGNIRAALRRAGLKGI